jgi:hypothetical protein
MREGFFMFEPVRILSAGETRNAYKILVGELEGRIPLGRPGRRWEDNIKSKLRETGLEGMNWINLTQGRNRWRSFVNTVMNLQIP